MRTCPFHGCDIVIPDSRFACIDHWASLSKSAQSRVWASYKAYRDDKLALEDLRRIQEEILAEFEIQPPRHQPCSSCRAPLIWAVTPNNRRMPLDAEPVATGSIVLRNGVAITLNGDMFDEDAKPLPGELRYTSHFSSCPDAAEYRRKKRK